MSAHARRLGAGKLTFTVLVKVKLVDHSTQFVLTQRLA